MGFEKSEIKVGTYREVGVLVEDRLDDSEKRVEQAIGAAFALNEFATGAKGLPTILAHADNELEKEIPDIETLKIVKAYIMRCIHAAGNLAKHWKNVEQTSRGEVHAYEKMHKQLRDLSSNELKKVDRVLAAVKSGKIEAGEAGHPGPSLKTRRQAEGQLELKAAAKGPVKQAKTDNGTRKTKTAKKKAAKLSVVKTPVVKVVRKKTKGGNGAHP